MELFPPWTPPFITFSLPIAATTRVMARRRGSGEAVLAAPLKGTSSHRTRGGFVHAERPDSGSPYKGGQGHHTAMTAPLGVPFGIPIATTMRAMAWARERPSYLPAVVRRTP